MNSQLDPADTPDRRSQRVAAWMADAAPEPVAQPTDVAQAWLRFRQRRAAATMDAPRRIWGLRPGWLGTAAGVALVATTIGTLGFSSTARTATARVLWWFRVTQITALPFDGSAAASLDRSTTAAAMRKMISDDVTVTLDEKSQPAVDAAQASSLAGFTVRYPADAGLGAPRFRVQGGKDFRLTVDRSRVQSILDDAGVLDAQLPLSLDGATVAVHIPRALAVMYGDCTLAPNDDHGLPGSPSGGNCVLLGEAPSPAVSLPPGLDVEKIAEVGLQMLGMSAGEAQQYCQTVDWTSTLVVPFPRSQAQSRQVQVDGVSGILLTRDQSANSTDPAHYFLLWSRQGILYSVVGAGDGTQGLTLASQLN